MTNRALLPHPDEHAFAELAKLLREHQPPNLAPAPQHPDRAAAMLTASMFILFPGIACAAVGWGCLVGFVVGAGAVVIVSAILIDGGEA